MYYGIQKLLIFVKQKGILSFEKQKKMMNLELLENDQMRKIMYAGDIVSETELSFTTKAYVGTCNHVKFEVGTIVLPKSQITILPLSHRVDMWEILIPMWLYKKMYQQAKTMFENIYNQNQGGSIDKRDIEEMDSLFFMYNGV